MLTQLRSLIAFARLSRDLNRLDEVFELGKSLRKDPALQREMVEYHGRTDEGRRALTERPRLGPLDLEALALLPDGTLGRTVADSMRRANLDPSAIPTLTAENEGEYVFAHYYETHDIWHAVTGFGVDKAGELGLQAFYLAQGPARLSAMILAAGLLELVIGDEQFDDRERRLTEIVRGYETGRRATNLFGVRWNEFWGVPLPALRERFRLGEYRG